MTIDEFFSWLAVTDFQERDSSDIRKMLDSVLDQLPEKEKYDDLADVLEELVAKPDFSPEDLDGLRERFIHLLPEAQRPLDQVQDDLELIAQGLDEASYETDRLQRFEKLLQGLENASDENALASLAAQMRELEGEFRSIWSDYQTIPVSPSEVTAESVGGHRFLTAAFDMWFQAFQQARANEFESAWGSASEGNRLLLTVSTWSDQLRSETTAEIALVGD